jgi:endonuclease/exonuclease/phosphatase family metal-dependent hydrolase
MIRNIKTIFILLAVALSATACFKPRDYDYSKWYEDPNGGDAGRSVKVMSFNLRSADSNDPGENSWTSRRPAVKAMLAAQNPLIMGCQECDPIQRKNIIEDDPRYAAIGVDLNGPGDCEECAVFYLKDSIEVLAHATFYLSNTPDVPSRLNGTSNYRVCTWGKMKMKKGGQEFYFFNTHLEYSAAQLRQPEMDIILGKIKEIVTEEAPMVLLGDFNCDEDDAIYNGIKNYGFQSCRIKAAVGDSHKTHNGFGGYAQTLDHAFYKGFAGVNKFATDRYKYAGITYISDHYPIWATLKF